jgi:hypothetical protein
VFGLYAVRLFISPTYVLLAHIVMHRIVCASCLVGVLVLATGLLLWAWPVWWGG